MGLRHMFSRLFATKNRAAKRQMETPAKYAAHDGVATIEDAWRDHFAPRLRSLGFKGSGRHFRKLDKDFVRTVNLQGSQYGRRFVVNLGLQPLGIPNVIGEHVDPKKIKEIECAFRYRLSENGCEVWWPYTSDPKTMVRAACDAADLFERRAQEYLDEQVEFILTVTPEGLGRTLPTDYVEFALLREAQGDLVQARAFVEKAVERASRNWVENSAVRHLL